MSKRNAYKRYEKNALAELLFDFIKEYDNIHQRAVNFSTILLNFKSLQLSENYIRSLLNILIDKRKIVRSSKGYYTPR